MKTGRFYATLRKCNISCTLDVETAKRFIGKQMPGNIVRVPVDAYEYTIDQTGEVITLTHRWDYMPEFAMVLNNQSLVVSQPPVIVND